MPGLAPKPLLLPPSHHLCNIKHSEIDQTLSTPLLALPQLASAPPVHPAHPAVHARHQQNDRTQLRTRSAPWTHARRWLPPGGSAAPAGKCAPLHSAWMRPFDAARRRRICHSNRLKLPPCSWRLAAAARGGSAATPPLPSCQASSQHCEPFTSASTQTCFRTTRPPRRGGGRTSQEAGKFAWWSLVACL